MTMMNFRTAQLVAAIQATGINPISDQIRISFLFCLRFDG